MLYLNHQIVHAAMGVLYAGYASGLDGGIVSGCLAVTYCCLSLIKD
mgnify:CR=1 FL=1